METDRQADVGDGTIRRAQQGGGTFESAGEEVHVWRLAKGTAKLAAEVGARKTRCASEIINAEALEISRVREVLGSQEMSSGRRESHQGKVSRGRFRSEGGGSHG